MTLGMYKQENIWSIWFSCFALCESVSRMSHFSVMADKGEYKESARDNLKCLNTSNSNKPVWEMCIVIYIASYTNKQPHKLECNITKCLHYI